MLPLDTTLQYIKFCSDIKSVVILLGNMEMVDYWLHYIKLVPYTTILKATEIFVLIENLCY